MGSATYASGFLCPGRRHPLESTSTRVASSTFRHYELDIRDRARVDELICTLSSSLIVHITAKPSHDLPASRSYDDFDVTAVGTPPLLEATRRFQR